MGIDYGLGKTNIDFETGIRYGVIPANDVDLWSESSDSEYLVSCPQCGYDRIDDFDLDTDRVVCPECDFMGESEDWIASLPTIETYKEDGYLCFQHGDDPDIFIEKSPYKTRADFCSPCAPGAVHLRNAHANGDAWGYCFGHDWFGGGKAPYPVYDVETGEIVNPEHRIDDSQLIRRVIAWAERKGYDIDYFSGIAEMGYDDNTAISANWNNFEKLGDWLESRGFEPLWSDEWSRCADCGKAVRINPDSYCWQASYVMTDDYEPVCHECMDIEDFIDFYSGNPRKAMPSWTKERLKEIGFRCYEQDSGCEVFESGFHLNMNDDPEKILESILESHGENFFQSHDWIFVINFSEQFSLRFSLFFRGKEGDES